MRTKASPATGTVWAALLLGGLGIGGAACSNGEIDDGNALDGPCAHDVSVGGFALTLSFNGSVGFGFTAFNGGVWDAPNRANAYRPSTTEGACSLMELPTAPVCSPACTGNQYCSSDANCLDQAVSRSVGIIQITGLSAPYSVAPLTGGSITYNSDADTIPYPPAPPGARIAMHTSGGDYAPFSLAGRGIPQLQMASPSPIVMRDQPFAVDWVAPSDPGDARVTVYLDLGQNAGLDAGSAASVYVTCDFPDTGSASIPASLVNRVLDARVGTGPGVYLRRKVVDSTAIAPGCVEFVVDSYARQPVTVASN